MKTTLIMMLALALTGCGHPLDVDGKHYPTYGFLNQNTKESKNICYEASVGNIVLSVIFSETVFIPIYFVGFDIFNPVSKKPTDGNCGIDAKPKP